MGTLYFLINFFCKPKTALNEKQLPGKNIRQKDQHKQRLGWQWHVAGAGSTWENSEPERRVKHHVKVSMLSPEAVERGQLSQKGDNMICLHLRMIS